MTAIVLSVLAVLGATGIRTPVTLVTGGSQPLLLHTELSADWSEMSPGTFTLLFWHCTLKCNNAGSWTRTGNHRN